MTNSAPTRTRDRRRVAALAGVGTYTRRARDTICKRLLLRNRWPARHLCRLGGTPICKSRLLRKARAALNRPAAALGGSFARSPRLRGRAHLHCADHPAGGRHAAAPRCIEGRSRVAPPPRRASVSERPVIPRCSQSDQLTRAARYRCGGIARPCLSLLSRSSHQGPGSILPRASVLPGAKSPPLYP